MREAWTSHDCMGFWIERERERGRDRKRDVSIPGNSLGIFEDSSLYLASFIVIQPLRGSDEGPTEATFTPA